MKFLKQIRQLPEILRIYKNPLSYYFAKSGFSSRNKIRVVRLRNGLKFKIHMGNSDINSLMEVFEEDYQKFFNSLVAESNFVDIGANIGVVSIFAAQKIKSGRIFAFEPNPYIFDLLEENIRLNGFQDKISVYNLGVAGKNGKRKLNFTVGDWGGASIIKDKLIPLNYKELEVQCIGLNKIFSLLGVGEIDFMKIDVEGAEFEILDGAGKEDLEKIKNIFVEYHEPRVSAQKLKSILESVGFAVEFTSILPPALYARRQ